MTDRAGEILAAYGADPERWPPRERVATAAAIARDPALVRALGDAKALDGAILGWTRATPANDATADAASARALAALPRPLARRLAPWAGGAIAAAVAMLLALPSAPPPPAGSAVPPIAAAAPSSAEADLEAFALLFTVTPEEEYQL